MSECPDCDETGWILEYPDDEEKPAYRVKCPNWRHEPRPEHTVASMLESRRRSEEAQRLQREDVEQRPYLFQRDPRTGRWGKNMHGTIMNPVWVPCSPFEQALLDKK